MNLNTLQVLRNCPCVCVSDLRNSFSNNGASSAKMSLLSKINHCNSNFFTCAPLIVESRAITATVQDSMTSITLWNFKQKSASPKVSSIFLVLTIHQRYSTNLCKSSSCSVYLFMACCSTRPFFFMGRRWYFSLQSVPWTVPGTSFIRL